MFLTPVFATHPRPPGIFHFGSIDLSQLAVSISGPYPSWVTVHGSRVTVHFPVSPFFSDSSALFPTTAIAYLLFIQSVAHSFHRNGGCTPLPTSFDIQTFRGFDVFAISPKVLYFQYHERRI